MKRRVKFKLGDLVQLSDRWQNKIGLVKANGRAWYVIRGHYDIADCICKASDVVKVITPNAVPKKLLRYC